MNKEKMMDAMSRIDPALVEEADAKAIRSRRRWVRPAAVAACLCLLLAGTVLAVESGLLAELIRGDEGLGDYSDLAGYEIAGQYHVTTARRVPVESFSQEVRELSDSLSMEDPVGYYGFSSWEAAEKFLGMDVMNNPLLDSARMGLIAIGGDEGCGPGGLRANSVVSIHKSSETGELICVRVTGNYNVDNRGNVAVTATLVSDRNPYEGGGGTNLLYSAEQMENLELQEYVTASGITASIVCDRSPTLIYDKEDVDRENPYYDDSLGYEEVHCTAFLPVGNAVVMVETSTSETASAEEALLLLQEVLDGFQ